MPGSGQQCKAWKFFSKMPGSGQQCKAWKCHIEF
jgi:hypothetical protein